MTNDTPEEYWRGTLGDEYWRQMWNGHEWGEEVMKLIEDGDFKGALAEHLERSKKAGKEDI